MPRRTLPFNYRCCERCLNFLALFYDGTAHCAEHGIINHGVSWCRLHEEESTAEEDESEEKPNE